MSRVKRECSSIELKKSSTPVTMLTRTSILGVMRPMAAMVAALATASTKLGFHFGQAIALGVLCNALVCLAVWLTFSARTTADRILAIVLPITAFVAAGFEHSVANMYFIPIGLFIRAGAPAAFWESIGRTPAQQ